MKKYKVIVSERYFAYKTIEVEAENEIEARSLAVERAEEIEITLR